MSVNSTSALRKNKH